MSCTSESIEIQKESFRLIVSKEHSTLVLIDGSQGSRRLPSLEIPKWTRVAESLTCEFKEKWGVDAFCLFDIESPSRDSTGDAVAYQILEVPEDAGPFPDELSWEDATALQRDSRVDPQDREAISSFLREAADYNSGLKPGPFARSGCLQELLSWAVPCCSEVGLQLTGRFRQLNASPSFSLLRLESTESAAWFKAVGEPNTREFKITEALARCVPNHIPAVIATRPDLNGWLMEEVDGPCLGEAPDWSSWQRTAVALAEIQIASAASLPVLLQAGCRNLRLPKIARCIDPFIEVIGGLMRKQPHTPPPQLSPAQLRTLASRLRAACNQLEALRVPDTLGHSDFNPGNVLVGAKKIVFIDWAEAYVGNPLFTLEYLFAHLRRGGSNFGGWESLLRSSYEQRWQEANKLRDFSEAFSLTPLLAVFAYALAGDAWRDANQLAHPAVAKYMRSLARRMYRESEELNARRVRCVA